LKILFGEKIKKKGYERQPYQTYPFNLNIIT